MIKGLAKLANRLDRLGLTKEADVLDVALQKLAQQVATTGVEGATYSKGLQVTPGFAGGPTVKFYKARPKSISEFNAFLGALITNAAADPRQTAFSPSVIKNLPSKADTTWGSKTQAAFKEYAAAAGFPEAGTNWETFAKNSGKYEPTMTGIFRFWEDTIAKVDADVALQKSLEELGKTDVGETKREVAPTGPAKIDWGPGPSPKYDPLNPLADLDFLTPEQKGDTPATAGANMSTAPIYKFSPHELWVNGSFSNRDPLNGQIWHISDADKKMLADLFSKDAVAQMKLQKVYSQNPGVPKEQVARENKQFESIIKEWYQDKLRTLGIKGYYPARAASGDKDPAPMAIPAGQSEPDRNLFDPSRLSPADRRLKGLISR
jgi:hypothetical protein